MYNCAFPFVPFILTSNEFKSVKLPEIEAISTSLVFLLLNFNRMVEFSSVATVLIFSPESEA